MPREKNCSWLRVIASTILVLFAIEVLSGCVARAETLRVGRAAQEFSFLPLDIGIRYGIFKKKGFEIESSVYGGGGQLQQALTANSIDIGLGSGPEMWSLAKGVPATAGAPTAGPPPGAGPVGRARRPVPPGPPRKVGPRVGGDPPTLSAWLGN